MLNTPPLPPDNPHALGDMLVSLVKLLADPQAAQDRIRDYTAAHAAATAAIEQAKQDVAAAAKVVREAEAEIARQREQWDFQQRHESDLTRARIADAEKEMAADRTATREARAAAEKDAAEAARVRADLERRLRIIQAA